MAGAVLSQGEVQISWQARHFRKAKFSQGWNCVAGAALSKGRGRRSTFVAGAALSQGQVKIRGRRSTFTRSSTELVAGAALSQGQVQISWQAQHFRKVRCQISWQAQHFRKVKYRFRGRRSIFGSKSQLLSTKVVREVNFRSWGLKIATFKYESSTRSALSQLGLENRNF